MTVLVVGASQAAELDRRTIAGGVPSRVLMQAAGRAAAALILDRFPLEAAHGVAVFAGPGNNGGDGWVVAAELAQRGVRVRVAEVMEPTTADAIAECAAARSHLEDVAPDGTEGVVVDALLGTGASGAPRGSIADAVARVAQRRADSGRPARVVALDVPSGVDATTGQSSELHVRADLTVTFGTVKRGLLANRDAAGTIVVADIGLTAGAATFAGAASLVDAAMVRHVAPPVGASAHKGIRKRLAIVGGDVGMAGATVLAARAAMRSGIGMVKLHVARASLAAVQAAEPAAMAAPWPESEDELRALCDWAHVMLIGPGIGAGAPSRAAVERLLAAWRGPVVLDADALRVFDGQPQRLASVLGNVANRPAVITPHVVEFARLSGAAAAEVEAHRFDVAGELARPLGCTVLLKGVPTVASDGTAVLVSATGTPVLATAGSGDVLAGIVATLLGQTGDALRSAAAGAWIHGRAAEIAGGAQVRGVSLHDVVDALRDAWRLEAPAPAPPILAELPSVGERR